MGLKIVFQFCRIMMSSVALLFFLTCHDLYASNLILDEEAVFCVYHKLSVSDMDDQDIEDFCFKRGRPTFTVYKPSEMFTKQTIKEFRKKMKKKIRNLGDDSLFTWRFKGKVSDSRDGKGYRVECGFQDMPRATNYINSEISKTGRRSLERILNSLVNRRSGSVKDRELDINIVMRPQRIAFRFQKRNIALEEVLLPIRYVIFHPISVEALDETMTIEN